MTELLNIVRNYRMQYTLDNLISGRRGHLNAKKQEAENLMVSLKLELSKSQFSTLNQYLDIQNYISAEYGEVAYELGLRDGVNLVNELEDLKRLPEL